MAINKNNSPKKTKNDNYLIDYVKGFTGKNKNVLPVKKTRGGKRSGAGRKKGQSTKVFSIRHKSIVIDELKGYYDKKYLQTMCRDFLNELFKAIPDVRHV
jgi:hypothetical protein